MLDLGCGDGARAKHFPGASYLGVDPLRLRSRYAFPFVRALGECLPMTAACVDAVVCIEVLDHVISPRHCVMEAARVLRPGGSLFVFLGLSADVDTSRRHTYSTPERDVHTHAIVADTLPAVLGACFEHVETFFSEKGYGAWIGTAPRSDRGTSH